MDDESIADQIRQAQSQMAASFYHGQPAQHRATRTFTVALIIAIVVMTSGVSNLLLWSKITKLESSITQAQQAAESAQQTASSAETAAANTPSFDPSSINNEISNLTTCVNNFFHAFSAANGSAFTWRTC